MKSREPVLLEGSVVMMFEEVSQGESVILLKQNLKLTRSNQPSMKQSWNQMH